MIKRELTILLALCLNGGCSFDSTFFPIDERPNDINGLSQEIVVLPSADGKDIHHFFIKPLSEPKATILVFHGSGSKVSNWMNLLVTLVEGGYQLFLMEYRGFGSSEGEASHQTVAGDANRAFLYLTGREDVKSNPLLLLGQSYGGQLVINIASKHPNRVDALVTEGAFTSFRNIAVYTTPWIGKPFTWAFFRNPYNSEELIRNSGLAPETLIEVGSDHRLADEEPLRAMLDAVERTESTP